MISNTKHDVNHVCSAYAIVKSYKLSFKSSHTPYNVFFELMYVDLWCSLVIGNISAQYFMLVVDDYYRFIWIFFLETKDVAQTLFLSFSKMVERNFEGTIKSVQSGDDFHLLITLLFSQGLLHRKTCHTLEQNWVVKVRNRRVVE